MQIEKICLNCEYWNKYSDMFKLGGRCVADPSSLVSTSELHRCNNWKIDRREDNIWIKQKIKLS